jgi:hypothetical protein
VSPVWLIPAALGVLGAVAVAVVSMNAVRRAESLRVSLSRMAELRVPLGRLAGDLRELGATVDEVRRK